MQKGLFVLVAVLVALAAVASPALAEQGPYEDIQALLATAKASADGLASLDSRGAPRVVNVVHHHHHLVPDHVPQHEAERIAEENTPAPPKVNIVLKKSAEQEAREQAEDQEFARHTAQPTRHSLDIQHSIHVRKPRNRKYTVHERVNGDAKTRVGRSKYHYALVDREHLPVLDGAASAARQLTTAAELEAEAAKLLARAKHLQAKRDARLQPVAVAEPAVPTWEENQVAALKHIARRMKRLQEQIEQHRGDEAFDVSIERARGYLALYKKLKGEAFTLIEQFALKTGRSIFSLFGDGAIDPSIAASLQPNSVQAIIEQYSRPTIDRTNSHLDAVSASEAKRILGDKLLTTNSSVLVEMEAEQTPATVAAAPASPLVNTVVATQSGAFGQGRPAVTSGAAGVGRSSVHITVLNEKAGAPAPFKVNLRRQRKAKAAAAAASAPAVVTPAVVTPAVVTPAVVTPAVVAKAL